MFLASTVAPGTLPPFSSSTSPCTLPVVACPCPNAVFKHTKLSATANATHNNFFIVLAPETETPYPQEGNSPEVGGARGFQDWVKCRGTCSIPASVRSVENLPTARQSSTPDH